MKDATNPKYEGESNTLKQPRDWELATTDNPVPDTLITSLLCNFATSTGISASRIIDSCHYGNVTYCRSCLERSWFGKRSVWERVVAVPLNLPGVRVLYPQIYLKIRAINKGHKGLYFPMGS